MKGKQSYRPFQLLNQASKVIIFGLVIFSIVYSINQIQLSRYFPIRTVQVFGVNHVNQQDVQEMLRPLVSHGFFTVNVEYVRDRLLQMPWVSDIFVRRNWPNQIEITIIEKVAIARWNEDKLLSGGGELFSPKTETYPADLPQFIGPPGQQILMLQYFRDINRLLAPLHAKISYLELTPYFTWKLKVDNGIMLQVGHKDILTRLDHFVKVYPKIVGNRAAEVDYVDLRYTNGVAVRWKTTAV